MPELMGNWISGSPIETSVNLVAPQRDSIKETRAQALQNVDESSANL